MPRAVRGLILTPFRGRKRNANAGRTLIGSRSAPPKKRRLRKKFLTVAGDTVYTLSVPSKRFLNITFCAFIFQRKHP